MKKTGNVCYLYCVIDVDKFYRIAARYVGDLNRDLVHHTFEKVCDKLPAENKEAYFHRSMRNELRSDSTFRKQYSGVVKAEIDTDEEMSLIDPERVNAILAELSAEGYRLEVKAFIEMSTGDSALSISKITGVRYNNLLKIRNFVKTEVIKRYGNID